MSLARFLVRRGIHSVIVMWAVVTVVFLLRFVTPGSPVDIIAPLDAPPELREEIARDIGLDQPMYVQYVDYLLGLLQGDMGYSYISGTAVSVRVFARLPPTVELAAAATVITILISIPLGVVSATRRHEPADYAATTFSLVGISTPNFWLGIMLILVVSVQLGLLPTSQQGVAFSTAVGMLVFEFDPGGLRTWLAHIILPAVTLGTYFTALIVRLTRSGMLDELGKEYIRAVQARGSPNVIVRYKHALRNTLIPVITILGLQFGALIGGAVITEAVFDWPGLGTLIIDSIHNRDWPIIQGALIVIGFGFVFINTAVDLLYARINPQVVYE